MQLSEKKKAKCMTMKMIEAARETLWYVLSNAKVYLVDV